MLIKIYVIFFSIKKICNLIFFLNKMYYYFFSPASIYFFKK